MSTSKIAKARNPEARTSKKLPAAASKPNLASKPAGKRKAACADPEPTKPSPEEAPPRVTKQEAVLTLLSRPDGVSVPELMQATDWQQHSVRGFLAGTVKKKLGFRLTSSKADGADRRYRIAARGR